VNLVKAAPLHEECRYRKSLRVCLLKRRARAVVRENREKKILKSGKEVFLHIKSNEGKKEKSPAHARPALLRGKRPREDLLSSPQMEIWADSDEKIRKLVRKDVN